MSFGTLLTLFVVPAVYSLFGRKTGQQAGAAIPVPSPAE